MKLEQDNWLGNDAYLMETPEEERKRLRTRAIFWRCYFALMFVSLAAGVIVASFLGAR